MNQLSRLMRRVRGWWQRDDMERAMNDEMRMHMEMEARDLERSGLSAEDAHRQAAMAFGGVERFKEEAREERPLQMFDNLTRDVRLALRQLRRSRGMALAAATLLALGIGGTVTVFSVLNAINYRPLPYAFADRLFTAQVLMNDARCGDRCLRDLDPDEADAFTANAPAIERLGTIRVTQGTASLSNGARVLKGAAVSESIVSLLSLTPMLGRGLTAADFQADAQSVMVLSNSAWRGDFGADSAVVGRSFSFGDATFTVVGVLNAAAELGSPLYAFNAPNTAQYLTPDRGVLTQAGSSTRVILRVRDLASVAQVRAQLDAQLQQRVQAGLTPASFQGRASVQSLRSVLANGYRGSFWILFGAVGAVLLITCLNVTGLFLARLTDRALELATRTALGASRFRLTQQVGTETLAIAAAGGLGGLFVAYTGTLSVRLLPPGRMPFWTDVSLDVRAIAVAVLLTAGAGLILSVAPLFVLSPNRLLQSLRETVSAGRSRAILRSTLVGIQVALSVILLGAAGLLTKVLVGAELRDTGMTKHSMLYVFLETPRYSGDAAALSLEQRIVDAVRRVPGVTSVAVEGTAPRRRPLGATDSRSTSPPTRRSDGARQPAMSIEGQVDALPSSVAPSSASEVSPMYFRTVGTKMLAGREFSEEDRASGTPVAVMDEPTARRLFGNENAIGKRVKFGDLNSENPWMTIVGISAGLVNNPLEMADSYRPQVFRPIRQFPASPSTVLVSFSSNSYEQREAVRTAIRSAEASLVIAKMLSVEESIGTRLFAARFNTGVLNTFALFALLLSCLGIYAAVSMSVAARQREIAIRVALGAPKREVVLVLVRTTAITVLVGLVAGVIATSFATRTLQSLLYGASAFNPWVFASVACVMFSAGCVAALLPARRAAGIDPAKLLRT